MARRRRREVKKDRDPRRERWEIGALLNGHCWRFIFPGGGRSYREAWDYYRDRIREPFIKANPGKRPYAEWVFELVPAYGERRIIRENTLDREAWTQWGILHTNTIPPIQEPERDYLERHGLLTADERIALEEADRKRLKGRENP